MNKKEEEIFEKYNEQELIERIKPIALMLLPIVCKCIEMKITQLEYLQACKSMWSMCPYFKENK